jgi:sec-independent protein translocase protein TatB
VFNLSGSEIVVILLLALVVLGPEKLPDALRRAGRAYAELKKMGNSFQAEVRSALDEPMKEMQETADLMRQAADFSDQPSRPSPSATPAARPASPTTTPGGPSVDDDLINRTLSGDAAPAEARDEGDELPTT